MNRNIVMRKNLLSEPLILFSLACFPFTIALTATTIDQRPDFGAVSAPTHPPLPQFQLTGFRYHQQMSISNNIQTALVVNLNDEEKTLVQSVLEVVAVLDLTD